MFCLADPATEHLVTGNAEQEERNVFKGSEDLGRGQGLSGSRDPERLCPSSLPSGGQRVYQGGPNEMVSKAAICLPSVLFPELEGMSQNHSSTADSANVIIYRK